MVSNNFLPGTYRILGIAVVRIVDSLRALLADGWFHLHKIVGEDLDIGAAFEKLFLERLDKLFQLSVLLFLLFYLSFDDAHAVLHFILKHFLLFSNVLEPAAERPHFVAFCTCQPSRRAIFAVKRRGLVGGLYFDRFGARILLGDQGEAADFAFNRDLRIYSQHLLFIIISIFCQLLF